MSSKDTVSAKITADTGAAEVGVEQLDQKLVDLVDSAEKAQEGVAGIGDGADAAAKEAKKSTAEVTKAFRDLGIRSDAVADRQRKKFTDAYETIANSGESSAEEITRAHKKLEQQLERVDRTVGKTDKNFKSSFRNIKKFSGQAAKALKAVAVAATAAFAAVGTSIASVSEQAQNVQIGAQVAGLGNTEKDLVRFQRFAAAIRDVGFDTDKAGDILKDFDDRVGDLTNAGSGPLVDFCSPSRTCFKRHYWRC